jgi:adenylate cyclase
MIALNFAETGKIVRGVSVRQIRMICGVILFAYLISHFLNHALGNISVEAMAWGLRYHLLFWQFLPVAIVFYSAVLVHSGLGIWALYERRQFRWRAIEPLQLVLGLSIPALIAAHVISMRLGHSLFAHDRFYPQVLHGYFAAMSPRFVSTMAVLVIAWTHGCIGLYFWLRMKTFFRRAAPFLLAAAVLVPVLALLGIYQGGRTVMKDSADPEWRAANLSPGNLGTPAEAETLERITGTFMIGAPA